jgi:hypothetical protein
VFKQSPYIASLAAQRVAPGELVLMDAGCELHGYASDVTRTWPVSGAFSRPQRALYELVLDTHRCGGRLPCRMHCCLAWEKGCSAQGAAWQPSKTAASSGFVWLGNRAACLPVPLPAVLFWLGQGLLRAWCGMPWHFRGCSPASQRVYTA